MDNEMISESFEVQEPKPQEYDSSKQIRKLVFIGIAVLVGCVVTGIFITQAIGWLVEWLIGFLPDKIEPGLHFSDFLGGAIGLTVGFIFDKICIDRINRVYAFRRFMMALRHEFDNIQCKKDKDDKSHIYIERDDKTEEVKFDSSGKVITENLLECYGVFVPVKELILDNIVTSPETMSLISNLPFADEKFKNRFTDFLGSVHRLISEYNQLVDWFESETEIINEDGKLSLIEKRKITEEDGKLSLTKKRKITEEECKEFLTKRQEINKEIDNFKIHNHKFMVER